ncbi:lysozyme [Prauserella marina]|uniref:lysozyme n=1 Tax=Prauserella marina TaxID=530584 RepID=A0A222VXF7_9PSEU|nr:lysozyme [Prauserella marina]ASR38619.1 lysozyme [Prauserella marina]PWV81944.1 GH25 family lysozyme M1 (1,4-beta-N-acetylmuramidase) [Prauserella marina]SDD15877.1 Lyzozyme M1 (1,4-beta-N-acetylmuramidase), GH25 family [Prauserella marina]
MSTGRRIWRRLVAAVAVGSASVLLLGTLTPATASPQAPDAAPQYVDGMPTDSYVETYDHPMGSQIARVEGDESTEETRGQALRPQANSTDDYRATATVPGIDVSGHQQNVDWNHWWGQGKRFAFVKATEGTGYKNPYFAQQYNGSYNVGMIRGAYHFALPDRSSGAAQANYFVDNGGGWSKDGKTLPGALDMEYNPYGSTCYGKSKSSMAAWIRDFHDTYHSRTGRYPVIYTSTNWWNQCVGTAQSFGNTVPLWVARYSSSVGTLPNGWSFHTFWQYTSTPIDQNSFNGSYDRLKVLATG